MSSLEASCINWRWTWKEKKLCWLSEVWPKRHIVLFLGGWPTFFCFFLSALSHGFGVRDWILKTFLKLHIMEAIYGSIFKKSFGNCWHKYCNADSSKTSACFSQSYLSFDSGSGPLTTNQKSLVADKQTLKFPRISHRIPPETLRQWPRTRVN